ncbi:hypothetical protein GALL_378170 [mine drainage metagenome]|uniref:Uncharacterized protein n=1 Tax=mine drainage metagenome TaxID=410659 RepID=A0A1J5QSH7_9ZZZZ
MPTARPSMRASNGVVDEIVAKRVASEMPAVEIATPSSAVARGIPAAMNEPNVTIRTTRATSTPRPSVELTVGRVIEKRSPPKTAVEPVGSAARNVDSVSRSADRVAAVMALLAPCIWTVTTAAEPSVDTPPVTWLPNGSVTAATWLVVLSWATALSTGPSMAASRTDMPFGATTTS